MRKQPLYITYDVDRNRLDTIFLGMRLSMIQTRISHFRDFPNV